MIVIHVGLKKSGSASIQTFFSQNAKPIRSLSVEYPRIGRRSKKAHHNFAYEIQRSRKFDPDNGTLAQCAEGWRRSPCRTMLLSSEMFEGADPGAALELKQHLMDAKPQEEFRIYLVIRDLVGLVPSSYAQKVKYGFHQYNFDEFFNERMQMSRVHYFDTAERWASAFGWENLRVRVLDSSALINGDLLDDLLAVCGVDPGADKGRLKRPGIRNSAPGWRVLEATRALSDGRHGLPETHPLLREISTRLADKKFGFKLGHCAERAGARRDWNVDRGQYLTRAQAQLCHELYCDAVARLNTALVEKLPAPTGLDERGFVERQFLPDASLIATNQLRSFYDDLWEFLARKTGREHE